jgi:D-3-phosphoglycerate dehydrogenase
MNWARRTGIKVVNTPDAPTLAVAELTIGMILNLLRKISLMDKELKNGTWKKRMGNLLKGKKVGIIGFGRIGQKVAKLLSVFECELSYHDPYLSDGLLNLDNLPLEELLGWADIVSIHACGNKTIIGEKEISLMKKGSWLINTSRGDSIDEEALYNSLKKGYLRGAAVDVFNEEPYYGKLTELDNIILTPHIGSYAVESRAEMEKEAVVNLLKELELPGADR